MSFAQRLVVANGFNTQPPEGGCRLRHYCFERKNGFQHTAARRRLPRFLRMPLNTGRFQHTAARRRLPGVHLTLPIHHRFQHTAARRRLRFVIIAPPALPGVSTHSRPKAAAFCDYRPSCVTRCFNTQPPEGGCLIALRLDN